MWNTEIGPQDKPIGYRWLVELFEIKTLPHYRWSFVSPKWEKKELYLEDEKVHLFIYPPHYSLSSDPFDHIEFALKHEGMNLSILKKVLEKLSSKEIENYIVSHPQGKYAKIVWFLYEFFFQKVISVPDLKTGNYTPLLNSELYYCGKPVLSKRHRVSNNLLGTFLFSPMVRKTERLLQFERMELDKKALELTRKYDPSVLERAMRYLSMKETISSWEIEREKPDARRLSRAIDLLKKAGFIDSLTEASLVALQKEIVDSRFALDSYRSFQNYIGEEPALDQLIVHYISPKPEDVPGLMNDLLTCFERMSQSHLCPVITATVLSFGFVFIHPFGDGNGRLHRFLIHHVLAKNGFVPEGFIFPIASVLLREMKQYDAALELFSRPLLQLITEYTVSETGQMSVLQDTRELYQYLDYTHLAEFVFECIEKTITTDLNQELLFLVGYDRARQKIKEIVDIPNQLLDLFIRCVRQNGGTLSARKREAYFAMLHDDEISKMEAAVNSSLSTPSC